MENKILEAVKHFSGEWPNGADGVAVSKKYPEDFVYGYILDNHGEMAVIKEGELTDLWINKDNFDCVGLQEFNTYAEQWLKQAYMHNAALDCNWDLYYRDGSELICTSDDIVVHFDVDVCTEKEFIDYCNSNKPCEEVKPVFTQEMADAGEMVKVGMRFSTEVGEYCAVAVNEKSVCFADEDGFLVSMPIKMAKPIKSPRDKAIECMPKAMHSGDDAGLINDSTIGCVYDWLKQLTPEQRKEFDL